MEKGLIALPLIRVSENSVLGISMEAGPKPRKNCSFFVNLCGVFCCWWWGFFFLVLVFQVCLFGLVCFSVAFFLAALYGF